MKQSYRLLKHIITALIILISLSSCSYGFFNFSSDTGQIDLVFDIVNTNALGVDEIVYELTPPKGISTSISLNYSYYSERKNVSNADTGTWLVHTSLYSENEFVQEFEYSIEILTDTTTELRMEAEYASGAYDIRFESWQNEYSDNSGSGDSGSYSTIPDFTFSGMKIMPAAYEEYRTGALRYGVNIRVLGSNLISGVKLLKLTYPDNVLYEYGYYDNFNRGYVYDRARDDMLEFNRWLPSDENVLNGSYKLRLIDFSGRLGEYEKALNLDFDKLMPSIMNTDIPPEFTLTDSYDFFYEFEPASEIGTMLVYIVNQNGVLQKPTDNSIAVLSETGSLGFISGDLTTGNYEFVVAALEHATTTPVDDAITAGLDLDMNAERLVGSLYELYGADTGFILYKSVSFSIQ